MLTIKSDDIKGRYVAFQSIIKGLPIPDSHVPESFKLLVRQLNGLMMAITPIGRSASVEEEVETPVVLDSEDEIIERPSDTDKPDTVEVDSSEKE